MATTCSMPEAIIEDMRELLGTKRTKPCGITCDHRCSCAHGSYLRIDIAKSFAEARQYIRWARAAKLDGDTAKADELIVVAKSRRARAKSIRDQRCRTLRGV